jgi:hypothetical protein
LAPGQPLRLGCVVQDNESVPLHTVRGWPPFILKLYTHYWFASSTGTGFWHPVPGLAGLRRALQQHRALRPGPRQGRGPGRRIGQGTGARWPGSGGSRYGSRSIFFKINIYSDLVGATGFEPVTPRL